MTAKLLKAVRTLPCLACGGRPSDPDHITTRGAGGKDTAENVWPLCRAHHQERHLKGLGHMIERYRRCLAFLVEHKRVDIFERLKSKGALL